MPKTKKYSRSHKRRSKSKAIASKMRLMVNIIPLWGIFSAIVFPVGIYIGVDFDKFTNSALALAVALAPAICFAIYATKKAKIKQATLR